MSGLSKGINVNAIAPGLYSQQQHRQPCATTRSATGKSWRRIPAGRWGEASDIGEAAVFLASPAAKYIHGAVLKCRWRLACADKLPRLVEKKRRLPRPPVLFILALGPSSAPMARSMLKTRHATVRRRLGASCRCQPAKSAHARPGWRHRTSSTRLSELGPEGETLQTGGNCPSTFWLPAKDP